MGMMIVSCENCDTRTNVYLDLKSGLYMCKKCAAEIKEAVAASTNSRSDEIIAGIVSYINARLASQTIEYSERQWCLNIRHLCGIQQ